jgi:uncharacterized protein DUF4158
VIVWTGGAAGVDEIFSDEEIKRLRSWPGELGRNELIRYFTLGSDDRDWLSRAARGVGNRLGLAVQMCTLPWLGFVPDDVADAPAAAVNRLAVQLGRRPQLSSSGSSTPATADRRLHRRAAFT